MSELNISQIEKISKDVRNQEITFSHLADDLIDHICCDVEDEMTRGLPFHEAYKIVIIKMGSRRLREIQEETLYAVDTKYRKMKNTMKFSGIAGTVLFGFAALFKIQHWTGAGPMMTLGAVILSFAFMPSALGVLWKETHSKKRLLLFISAFFTAMFFIFGVLFKVQHWPKAGILINLSALSGILFFIPSLLINTFNDTDNKSRRSAYIIGLVGIILFAAGLIVKIHNGPFVNLLMTSGFIVLGLIALPWFVWITWKDEVCLSSKFIFIVIAILAIAVPATLFNLSLEHSYQEGFYTHLKQQQIFYEYLCKKESSMLVTYRDSSNYSKMEELHARTDEILKMIGILQVNMVGESEGKSQMPEVSSDQIKQTIYGPEIQYRYLSKPFIPSPSRDFLKPGSKSRGDLTEAFAGYVKYLSSLIPEKDLQMYGSLLEPSSFLPADDAAAAKLSLITGLHTLGLLKNSLLTVEISLLNVLNK